MSTRSEKLVSDLRILIEDTEELVKATAAQAGEKITEVRQRAQHAAEKVRPQLSELQSTVVQRTRVSAAATEDYVRQNPWTAVGVSALAGVVLGLLISRR
jgi:ElaB/YqjD/DUF883 family membrane-anchored ribosome-binding protein